MSPSTTGPTTLLGLMNSVPADRTAVIVPEQNIRISYGELRRQVEAFAEALAASGVGRGDRVGIALPNGLPNIVAFLGASMAGTAAPLNPAYKEDEFRFYLEDTNARVLVLPPEGIDEARRAAADTVPVLTVEMSETGTVSLSGVTKGRPVTPPTIDDVALVLHTSGSTGRPKRVPLSHANLSISRGQRGAQLRPLAGRRVAVRDAALPRPRPRGLDARDALDRRHGRRPGQVQPAVVLANRPRLRRHLVFGGADDSSAAPGAGRTRSAKTGRRREAPLHPVVQRIASAAGHARPRGGVRSARAGGVRHDRGRPSDGVQSPAAQTRAFPDRLGREPTCRSASWTAKGRHLPAGERGEVCHSGSQRDPRVREQSRGERHVVLQRVVSHRRSGRVWTRTDI